MAKNAPSKALAKRLKRLTDDLPHGMHRLLAAAIGVDATTLSRLRSGALELGAAQARLIEYWLSLAPGDLDGGTLKHSTEWLNRLKTFRAWSDGEMWAVLPPPRGAVRADLGDLVPEPRPEQRAEGT